MSEETNFFSRPASRRQFLKGAAGAAVSVTLLGLFGCGNGSDEVKRGELTGLPLPQGVVVVNQALCVGCGLCEAACTMTNDGRTGPTTARIKVDLNANFGEDGPRLNYRYGKGIYGDFTTVAQACRQCRSPYCANACPKGAIKPDKKTGARLVDKDLCDGCGLCTAACPWGLPTVDPATKVATKCTNCGACVPACPTGALTIAPWSDFPTSGGNT